MNNINKYFKIQELVSKDTYDKYGEKKCWEFFNPNIIKFINLLREDLGKPITINDWLWGGSFTQRGLRTNLSPMVKEKTNKGIMYVSAHVQGCALDFNVKDMSVKEVYNYIIKNYDRYKNYITRIENINSAPTWIHVDCIWTGKNKLVIFK